MVLGLTAGGPMVRTAARIWRHPANRKQRLYRLSLWLAWQLWERLVCRPWTITMPPALRLQLHPHDPVTSGVLYCGLPDWPEMPFVLDYLRAGDVMVDVGANVGLYSLLAASIDGVAVLAFEPDDGARARAGANSVRNGLSERIEFRSPAVGSTSGSGRLTSGLGPLNHLLGQTEESTKMESGTRPVAVVTLDEAVNGPVALVKVDVEGGEVAVVDGAGRLLHEFHPVLILEANEPSALTDRLGCLGYQWLRYDPERRRVVPAAPPAPGQNGIAAADLEAIAARLAHPSPSGDPFRRPAVRRG